MDGLEHIALAPLLTVTLTLLAVIDILGSVPILLSLKSKMGDIHAGTATLVSGMLMILFLVVGEKLLSFMGIDVSSFAIAGSIVIFILALEMVLGHDLFRADTSTRSGNIVPIAFPIIAGSGTLTTIMSFRATVHVYNIILGILINLLIVFIALKSLNTLERWLGPNGIAVVRKFFGVILLAIAVKIFRTNIGI
ncbi:MAG: MarC family protein [Sphingobacteriales bacterium]|jgi:multiple antibiotic resistance protein|nr:MAG: MarC family protein [Sphingobacteriales bacterium]